MHCTCTSTGNEAVTNGKETEPTLWSRLLNLAKPKTKPEIKGRVQLQRPEFSLAHQLWKKSMSWRSHADPPDSHTTEASSWRSSAAAQAMTAGGRGAGAGGAPLLVGDGMAAWRNRCPGCRQQRKVQASDRIPYVEFLYIWISCLCAGTNAHASFFLGADRYACDAGVYDLKFSISDRRLVKQLARWPSLTVE